MMISGKSALRKNRFNGEASRAGYQRLGGYRAFAPGRLCPFWDLGRIEDAHVGQVAVPLGEVEPVSDDEAVRDLESDVAHRNVDLATVRLRQQGADLQGRRPPRLEVADEVREREPGVDDVLDDEDMPALDVDVEVLENA